MQELPTRAQELCWLLSLVWETRQLWQRQQGGSYELLLERGERVQWIFCGAVSGHEQHSTEARV